MWRTSTTRCPEAAAQAVRSLDQRGAGEPAQPDRAAAGSGQPGQRVRRRATPPPVQETISTLENDAVKITFTSIGAAIKEVELKLQKADNGGNIILNQQSRSNVMTVNGWPGADKADFTAQVDAGKAITFTTTLPNGLQWQRKYAFGQEPDRYSGLGGTLRRISRAIGHALGRPEPKPEVYNLDVIDTVTNPGATDVTLPDYSLSVGRAEPLYDAQGTAPEPKPNSFNTMYVGSGWLTAKFHLTTISEFNPTNLLLGLSGTRPARQHFQHRPRQSSVAVARRGEPVLRRSADAGGGEVDHARELQYV